MTDIPNNVDHKLIERMLIAIQGQLNITRVTSDEARRLKGETDWARLDAMTDDDIAKAVAEDPNAPPLDIDWSKARLVIPPGKDVITLRLDRDLATLSQRVADGQEDQKAMREQVDVIVMTSLRLERAMTALRQDVRHLRERVDGLEKSE